MSAKPLAVLGIPFNPRGAIEQRVACPQCSKREREDTLGVNTETGVYHCFRCGWAGRAGGDFRRPAPVVARVDDPAAIERKRERLRAIWRGGVALADRGARVICRYLEARGLGEILKQPPAVLRAHPALEYWDGARSLGTFPAMIGLFHGSAGEPVTLHVTYLRADGCAKAPVPSPKKILGVPVRGATRGGAIRLYPPKDGVLGVCEGIENALSLHILEGFPVWSSFCAGNLQYVRFPDDLRFLHVGVDLDKSEAGEKAAKALAARARRQRPDIRVVLWYPEIGNDLNAEILHRRAS
ncbi:MAG: DUF7146 domain-containing protein [Steroidobacteraceae bacterium]